MIRYRDTQNQGLFFANQGAFLRGDYAKIMNKVSALSIPSRIPRWPGTPSTLAN